MPKLIFIEANGCRREVEAEAGRTLLDIAQEAGLDMEGACEGAMSCSTCHVIVEADWFARLPAASGDEDDMLDFAFGLTPTSRLACQIVVSQELDGLTLNLPLETHNMLLG